MAATALHLGFPTESACPFESAFRILTACCFPSANSALAAPAVSAREATRLLASAEHHRVVPALNVAIPSCRTSTNPIRLRAMNHAWRALQLTAELARIAHHFEQHGIEFLAHKGPVLGQLLYGNPALRQFGDLDLLVRPQHVERSVMALVQLGYEPRIRLSGRQETSYIRSGYEYAFCRNSDPAPLELHWRMVPRFFSIRFDIAALFDRSRLVKLDNSTVRTLGNEDLLLALCVHAAKHEWAQLGMLRDIFTLSQFELDWNWILPEARKLGILKIVQASVATAHVLASPKSPTPIKADTMLSGVGALVVQIIENLQKDHEPDTDSIGYFRRQIRIRERWSDRVRFVTRLATTPSIEEWKIVQISDRFSGLYHLVRASRLLKRFLNGTRRLWIR